MADARCRFLKMAGLALLGCIFARDAAARRRSEQCRSLRRDCREMSLGAALPHVRAKLRQGQLLTIVALGSSSTTGFGTLGPFVSRGA